MFIDQHVHSLQFILGWRTFTRKIKTHNSRYWKKLYGKTWLERWSSELLFWILAVLLIPCHKRCMNETEMGTPCAVSVAYSSPQEDLWLSVVLWLYFARLQVIVFSSWNEDCISLLLATHAHWVDSHERLLCVLLCVLNYIAAVTATIWVGSYYFNTSKWALIKYLWS